MTNQEAFDRATIIHDTLTTGKDLTIKFNSKNVEWIIKAAEAIEKQIPMKPIEQGSVMPIYDNVGCIADEIFLYKAMCPNCGNVLADGELVPSDCVDIKFCDKCGQAIDFSEEVGK